MMSIDGKTKDSLNLRLDLREMGIREIYHPKVREDGKLDFLPGDYTLSDDDNRVLCKWLFELQVLDGYSGNLSQCVAAGERSISRYLHRVETKFNQRDRNDDGGQSLSDTSQLPIFSTPGKSFGKDVLEEMIIELLEAAKFYVLQNCDECLPFIQEHKNIRMHSGVRNMKESHRLQFSNWFHGRIKQLYYGNKVDKQMLSLAFGLESIGNLVNLVLIGMEDNYFSGSLPEEIGRLQKLEKISLGDNNLSGPMSSSLGNLTSLIELYLIINRFVGNIPPSLGDCQHPLELDLSDNNLTGTIPKEVFGLSSLSIYLRMYDNHLTGSLPSEVGLLVNLVELDLSGNNLSAENPTSLGICIMLVRLNLESNEFQRIIPQSLKSLKSLEDMDLSRNNLSGQIPEFLSKFKFLTHLNPSYNNFEGKITEAGIFSNGNLIGSRNFGSVYKGVLPSDGTLVAIKVLNLLQQRASKSFMDKCKALRSIRHINLLKIIIACSSIDNQGQDFKSLVFEYMVNGSLDAWLHLRDDEQSRSKGLSLIQKLNIAIDIASALDYIHHRCGTLIVHCDMKPRNVLLDEDMVAHVGDFGLARFILEKSDDPS
ncbi:probable LRR receptor-like serine/threonine-protein kinase At3g47570 [Pyrus communis]|uniref:probable LRR receptor-like serine/threonine-protein kinase At3g47570 n=1 Tax=Pyrus communis TaxID=23211 RepID=UPI0035C0DC06